jgi:hypothetical protein
MHKQTLILSTAIALLLAPLGGYANPDQQQLKQEAVSIVKKFGGTLKPELKKALQSGGPAHAVSVCSEKAPAIAEQLRGETGWYIKRVSLKNRNPDGVPDAWERKVLEQFDARQAGGESAEKMAFAEVVDGRFRFMKAQGVEAVCMNCHAENVSAEVEAALKAAYPQDKARGYSLGQIRGAFSLARDL